MQSSSVTSATVSLPRSLAERGSNKELPFPCSSVGGTQTSQNQNQNQRSGDGVSSVTGKGQSPAGAVRRKREQKPVPNNNLSTPTKRLRPNDDGGNDGNDSEDVVNLYVKHFPKSPTGTVATWNQCLEVALGCREKLDKLWKEEIKTMTAEEAYEKATALISELKSHRRIEEIDLDLEWSEVEEALSSILDDIKTPRSDPAIKLKKPLKLLGEYDKCDRDNKGANQLNFLFHRI